LPSKEKNNLEKYILSATDIRDISSFLNVADLETNTKKYNSTRVMYGCGTWPLPVK
jgi:hypothetical protein